MSPEKKLYEVLVEGCDDETRFNMVMTNQEYEFLLRVCKKANETSEYCCMPRLYVKESEENHENNEP